MSARITDDELLHHKRALRLRIGRARRRINNRLRATQDNARQLISWRTYVIRYPAWSLAAALGAGMAASAALNPARLSRWLGRTLMHGAVGGFQHQIVAELQRIWNDSNVDR